MEIRLYSPADAAALAPLYRQLYPDKLVTTATFNRHLRRLSRAWVVEQGGQVVGYAAVQPIPGLDGVLQLQGSIAPAVQRQGLGSHLLQHLVNELRAGDARQLSYPVSALDSPAALFLRRRGFIVEHEEWQMQLDDLAGLPAVQLPPECVIKNLPQSAAVPLFRRLYRQSFGPHPWFQDYSNDAEVRAELKGTRGTAADWLFLFCEGEPAGFAWTRLPEPAIGEIEPIGIVPEYQGKGYGRQLLLAALHSLRQRGAVTVQLGLWASNTAALHLYHQTGFHHTATTTYLAYHLTPQPTL